MFLLASISWYDNQRLFYNGIQRDQRRRGRVGVLRIMEFTEQELLYLHNCTGAHKFVVRARDPYPDSLDEIYYSVRKKLTDLIDNNSAL